MFIGVDEEDIKYLKQMYDKMLTDDAHSYWLTDTHWVGHQVTDLSRRTTKHNTGCARTQGFYKMDPLEKQKYKVCSSSTRVRQE